jgi:hypothetical protein
MEAVLHTRWATRRVAWRKANPVLKIARSTRNEQVIFTLLGRVAGKNLAELKRVVRLEPRDHNLVLDLKDVTLVDQSAIRFLARCDRVGLTLENCPAYIRDWMAAETHRHKRRAL